MILCACELYRVNEVQEKAAWPPHEATDYIKKQAGTQFSPELTEVFLWLVEHDKRVSALFNRR